MPSSNIINMTNGKKKDTKGINPQNKENGWGDHNKWKMSRNFHKMEADGRVIIDLAELRSPHVSLQGNLWRQGWGKGPRGETAAWRCYGCARSLQQCWISKALLFALHILNWTLAPCRVVNTNDPFTHCHGSFQNVFIRTTANGDRVWIWFRAGIPACTRERLPCRHSRPPWNVELRMPPVGQASESWVLVINAI